ncbi:unnamed protein product, partial [Amoebophrya sp. A25]
SVDGGDSVVSSPRFSVTQNTAGTQVRATFKFRDLFVQWYLPFGAAKPAGVLDGVSSWLDTNAGYIQGQEGASPVYVNRKAPILSVFSTSATFPPACYRASLATSTIQMESALLRRVLREAKKRAKHHPSAFVSFANGHKASSELVDEDGYFTAEAAVRSPGLLEKRRALMEAGNLDEEDEDLMGAAGGV